MNKYNEIDQDINRFLVGKSKLNPFNFIPFEVKIVKKQKVSPGLMQLRSLYNTAYSMKRQQPHYMSSIKTQRRQRSLQPSSMDNEMKQDSFKRKRDHSMLLQHLYSHQYLDRKSFRAPSEVESFSLNKLQAAQKDSALESFINDDLFATTVSRFKSFLKTQNTTRVKDILTSKRSFDSRGYSTRKSFRVKRYQ